MIGIPLEFFHCAHCGENLEHAFLAKHNELRCPKCGGINGFVVIGGGKPVPGFGGNGGTGGDA